MVALISCEIARRVVHLLVQLHRLLDEAVAAAYGWPNATGHDDDDMVQRLLSPYRGVAAGSKE